MIDADEQDMPTDRLDQMYRLQTQLQVSYANGTHPSELPAHVQMNYIRTMALALTDEIHEALNETGWKPWATSNHINADAYKAELVDAWHFFMNLMMVTGMTMEELYEGYLRKREVNIRRQEEGYDGVTTKCPNCKRAYDDLAVLCHPDNPDDSSKVLGPAYCDVSKAFIGDTTRASVGKLIEINFGPKR